MKPGIKPQDVLLLLKLLDRSELASARVIDLAVELGISASEVSHGLHRLKDARLISEDRKSLLRENIFEFLVHGLKYIFPAKLEAVRRGIPTAHSAHPLDKLIRANKDDSYVWADENGSSRGHSIAPLYPSAPKAATKDPRLHELLALVDALRIGRAREQKLAHEHLRKRIFDTAPTL